MENNEAQLVTVAHHIFVSYWFLVCTKDSEFFKLNNQMIMASL